MKKISCFVVFLLAASVAMADTVSVTIAVTINDSQVQIVTDPDDLEVYIGQTATFTIEATGAGLSYQWLKDGIAMSNSGNVSGVATPTLVITNCQAQDQAGYSCRVTDAMTNVATSATATLTVYDRMSVIGRSYINGVQAGTPGSGPEPEVVGAVAANPLVELRLEMTATGGKAPYTYQWFKDGVQIDGETNASLTINATQESDEATAPGYTCTVMDTPLN